ncbi:hypothetical protein EYF80_051408 [Liparis tanakae]|uniref:Uncharacterized protein n=1 Tax=Liparis tanakae TaxID=230148 RepID=A0A4Z2FDH4_9TELE|nr:hypothetical protein EYF80_051408 [Liparis tanakae]
MSHALRGTGATAPELLVSGGLEPLLASAGLLERSAEDGDRVDRWAGGGVDATQSASMCFNCGVKLAPRVKAVLTSEGTRRVKNTKLSPMHVVVGVEEGQLLHHGLFGDEVEDLRDLPVFDDGHAAHGVLPLDAVQDHHVAAVAGAAQPAQAAEREEARHGCRRTASEEPWSGEPGRCSPLVRVLSPLRPTDWASESPTGRHGSPLAPKEITCGIFLGFIFVENRGPELREVSLTLSP